MEPRSRIDICQAVHNACFDYAQSALPRSPLAIAEWVHDRVPGGELWDTMYELPDGGWMRNCILRFGRLNIEVERLVARYDAGAPLPDLRAHLRGVSV
jgi:hypothetical protein